MKRNLFEILSLALVLSLFAAGGCSTQQQTVMPQSSSSFNVDTVRAGQFDTGKMWTFDYPPTDYFKQAYNFAASKEWYEKARLGALRLPGCTASSGTSGRRLRATSPAPWPGAGRRAGRAPCPAPIRFD